jgi:hypothetical protein
LAFVTGVNQPFGFAWDDERRLGIPAKFGRKLFFADPLKYFKVVALDSWTYLANPAGYQFWLPPGWAQISDVRLARRLDNPEWPVAVLVSYSSIQSFLSSRVAILIVGLFGLLFGLMRAWGPAVIVAAGIVTWAGMLLLLVPNSRYLMMPLCLLFLLMGVCLGSIPYITRRCGRLLRRSYDHISRMHGNREKMIETKQ